MPSLSFQRDIRTSYALPRLGRPASRSFRKWAWAALHDYQQAACLSIYLVGEEHGRVLNHQFRGKDYATNVLSFPAELPENVPLPYLGELILCAPVVEREANEQGKALRAHYAHLTVHGILHLLGWDHEDDSQALAMEQREREILASLGYADPYLDE